MDKEKFLAEEKAKLNKDNHNKYNVAVWTLLSMRDANMMNQEQFIDYKVRVLACFMYLQTEEQIKSSPFLKITLNKKLKEYDSIEREYASKTTKWTNMFTQEYKYKFDKAIELQHALAKGKITQEQYNQEIDLLYRTYHF